MQTKQELRADIRRQKKCRTKEQTDAESDEIMRRLLLHPRVMEAKNVLMYYSLPDEVNTHRAVLELAKMGKRVLLPKVIDDGRMEIRVFKGEDSLKEGAFGIKEPVGETFTDIQSIDVAVVPGMSFDRLGHRLGRGKGYYDRFLSTARHIYKIGVCFSFQKRDAIPADQHDVTMDEVM